MDQLPTEKRELAPPPFPSPSNISFTCIHRMLVPLVVSSTIPSTIYLHGRHVYEKVPPPLYWASDGAIYARPPQPAPWGPKHGGG